MLQQDWADDTKLKLAKRADKKELLTDFGEMYRKILDFTATLGRSGRPTPSQEETLSDSPSIVDKGKYSKKFADVSREYLRFYVAIRANVGRSGQPSASQEETLSDSPSIVDKGKYSKKFADVSREYYIFM